MIVSESARLSNVEDLHKKCKKIIYKGNSFMVLLSSLLWQRGSAGQNGL